MENESTTPSRQTAGRPVSELEARERELLRVNRALATLTRATEALIRASDEQHLLNEICRILVEVGGYAFAWVGYVQHDDDCSIWPVARFGSDNGFLGDVRLSWGKDEKDGGPIGRAIATAQPQLTHVDAQDVSPWREAVRKHGFFATMALPLEVDGSVIGILGLYANAPAPFDTDEQLLMEKLARNVAWGIGMQRMQFERRRAAQELKESEGRYRSLVELSPDAIVVHTQGIIIFSNTAADRLFRASAGKTLVGKRMTDLMHAKDPSRPHPHLEAEGIPEGLVEERLRRLDGDPFIAEVTAASIIFHGVHARQVVIRDITERKQVQAQLVQSAKLATLGEMAAGMAHELSQPINIIRMAADGTLLMINRGKASAEYQEKQFGLIAAQASRMAEIIDHIRIFSRKDTGAVTVFDARDSVRLAVELMESQLQADDIAVVLRRSQAPCPVRGRPVQLEQVIINLLANAQDAIKSALELPDSPPGSGRIRVDVALPTPGTLGITVTDNGTGIGPQSLDRIFEPFFTTKDVGNGTGLGLSVSFGIISAMGGRLEARDILPRGARFTITLPLVSETACDSLPSDPVPTPQMSPRHHILLVDDEPQAIDAMSDYLCEFGYRVSRAYSGNAAFRLFESDPADIVVTDIRMPDGDGEELVRRLRQRSPVLPIVVVTGHMGATEHIEDDVSNALTILKKPISLATMTKTIEHLLHTV
ncbi:ATP-binding protein [Telmatospirillum sp.]|uniref:hybrid sensor histidine kinase/response regulator n=1 Tax=Telmatospirillum sp. TaxID=2079197 RepID=UPI0028497582|nr:ATP-binding protein [Telmatospirillum sp.]MDR3440061.1 response regulator [Telmatospirillum sp.]